MLKRYFRRGLQRYFTFHRHPFNRVAHIIGVPVIFIAVLSLVTRILVPLAEGSAVFVPYVAMALYCASYFFLDWRWGASACVPLFTIAHIASSTWVAEHLVFVAGAVAMIVVAQLVGHRCFEASQPPDQLARENVLFAAHVELLAVWIDLISSLLMSRRRLFESLRIT